MIENNQDLELNISDYLKIIWRHKWVILLITLITTAIIFLPALNRKPVYECSALISPARISGQLLEKTEVTILILQQEEALKKIASKLDLPSENAYLLANQFEVKSKNDLIDFLEIKGFGSTAEEAKKITEMVSDFILSRQGELLAQYKLSLEKEISFVNERLEKNEQLIKDLENKIKDLQKISNQSQGQQSISMYNNNLVAANGLQAQFYTKKRELNLQTQKPYFVIPPALPLKPNPADKKNSAVIGVLLGLFIGIFYAFVTESWRKNKIKV